MKRALFVTFALLAACSQQPRTQVMLILDADPGVRAAATRVEVQVAGRAMAPMMFEHAATFVFDPRDTGWPIEIAMVPAGNDASRSWRAIAAAIGGGDTIVEQQAIGPFVAEQTLSYTLTLRSICEGVDCDGSETCGPTGTCESAMVQRSDLVPYVPTVRTDAGVPDEMDASPRDGGADGATDAARDATTVDGPTDPTDGGCLLPTTAVDLVLMIDNSNSMAEEQTSLTAELPGLVAALSSGDADGDGVRDFPPIDSLRIGVVTSDMGSSGFAIPSCGGGAFGSTLGDDGVAIGRGNTTLVGCDATYPPVFEYLRGGGVTPATFARGVACVATAGTGGCGFEQQLEAVLKAVAPAAPTPWTAPGYVAPTFFMGTTGHGDDENALLLREDSVLAIILVTDEEDCSVSNPELHNPSGGPFVTTDLNLRCFMHPEAVHPISRFVDGLMQMRRDPRRLVYAAIAGIPVAADPGASAPNYTDILGHPAMTEEVDPGTPNRLRPSCNVAGRGVAFPPRRIVSVARDLTTRGAATTVHSICQDSYAAAIQRIGFVIGERVEGSCEP